MKKIIIYQGLPASGKTTHAKEEVLKSNGAIKRLNKDDLRDMLDAGKWSKSNEQVVLLTRNILVEEYINLNYDVIIDDTNLDQKHIDSISDIAKKLGAEVEIKSFLDVPLAECLKRDAYRGDKKVGYKVITDMHNRYIKKEIIPIEQDETKPKNILCDLDGTLALIGDRNVYDASKCEVDTLNKPVAKILFKYGVSNVIFMSGRQMKDRKETIKWLEKNGFDNPCGLYMRETDDVRPDEIVKKELFNTHIKGKYNIEFVLDDRQKVVDMWRSIGLTCLQVAEGNF